jgi:L-serine dehydratase
MKFRFHNYAELTEILKKENVSAPDYALKREVFISGSSIEETLSELDRRIEVTRKALVKGLQTPQRSRSGLTRGAAATYACSEKGLVRDGLFRRAIAYALAINEVNACGGKIVSFPTAGSCGIVPGTIWAWWDRRHGREQDPGYPKNIEPWAPPYDEKLREAFLVSSLAGILIAQGATLAGSEGGCQAECGAAGAMAAAALSWLEGLSLDQCFSAAALSLKNSLGLACDPVAGLVEVPCVKRNAFVAVNALTAVDLTLPGIESIIPFDEVVWAMKQIGNALPVSIKENSTGGLAMTPTGLSYRKKTGDIL